MRSRMWAALAMAGAAAACGGDRPYTGPMVRLAVDGRVNDNVSAAARGSAVAVAWSATAGDTTDVYVATSRDGGTSFDSARRVNAVAGDARVSGEQPPRVTLADDVSGGARSLVVWTRREPGGTRIVWAAGGLDGRYSEPVLVPGTDGVGNRGWESVASAGDGRVLALWLDHRDAASQTVAPMHRHGAALASGTDTAPAPDVPPPDAVERAGRSRLWIASLDGGVEPHAITGGVCYCCKTALAASGQRVVAAWRHVFPGNQRDIAFAQSADGGRTFSPPMRVSADHWKFDGCPENGPAIAIDRRGVVYVAWVTPKDGVEGAPLALYVASTVDGARFTARSNVHAAGAVGHVQLTAPPAGGLVLAWDEATPAGRVVRVARCTAGDDGRPRCGASLTMPGTGEHPALAMSDRGAVLAWVRTDQRPSVIQAVRVQ